MAPPAIRRADVRAWVARRLAAAPSTPVGYVADPTRCLLATYLRAEHAAPDPRVGHRYYTLDSWGDDFAAMFARPELSRWARWVAVAFDGLSPVTYTPVYPAEALALLDDLPPDPDEGPEGGDEDEGGADESDGGAVVTVPEPERELAGVA